jgi:hypothetical protein
MTLEGNKNKNMLIFRTSVEDDDLYRFKDARVTTNFDRTKYNYDLYFFSPHYYAYMRNQKASRDHPDDPRVCSILILFILNFLDELETPKCQPLGREIH